MGYVAGYVNQVLRNIIQNKTGTTVYTEYNPVYSVYLYKYIYISPSLFNICKTNKSLIKTANSGQYKGKCKEHEGLPSKIKILQAVTKNYN